MKLKNRQLEQEQLDKTLLKEKLKNLEIQNAKLKTQIKIDVIPIVSKSIEKISDQNEGNYNPPSFE